jgi:ABC-type uncharacterized transport system permease subunit
LPAWFFSLNNFLPFKYILFVPVSVLMGRMQPDIWLFLVPVCWIIVLYFINKFVYKWGLKKYESFGG